MTLFMGVIGCGTHAQHHVKHYGPHFATGGVWDPNPTTMAQMSGNKCSTLAALLGNKSIDAVMICSPDKFHLEQIELALEAGKHVFCEKPLLIPGQNMARLEAAFDFAEKRRLALTSCHPRRYDRPFLWFQNEMAPGPLGAGFPARFGQVISFDFDFSYHAPSTSWKHARSLLLDHLNHEVDLMNCLFGIQGFVAWKLHDGFDHYDVVGTRDDGITFHFRGTRRLKAHVYPEWCRVRFERGEVVLDMMMGVAHIYDHDRKTAKAIPNLAIDYEKRLEKVMANFGAQITRGRPGYLSRAEMLMNTEAGIVLQNEGLQRVSVRR